MAVIKAVNHENSRDILKQRPYGTSKRACCFDVLIKVDNMRDIIDRKFKNL